MLIHSYNISNTHFNILVVTLLLACAANWVSCYTLSIYSGKVTGRIYFLSRAMAADPARIVANCVVPFIACATAGILALRAVLLVSKLTTKNQMKLFYAFCVSSALTPMSMIAVSAVPYSLDRWLHLISAALVFSSGLATMVLSCILDHMIQLPTSKLLRIYRVALVVLGLCTLIVSGATYKIDSAVSSLFEILGAATLTLFTVSIATRNEFPLDTHEPKSSSAV